MSYIGDLIRRAATAAEGKRAISPMEEEALWRLAKRLEKADKTADENNPL